MVEIKEIDIIWVVWIILIIIFLTFVLWIYLKPKEYDVYKQVQIIQEQRVEDNKTSFTIVVDTYKKVDGFEIDNVTFEVDKEMVENLCIFNVTKYICFINDNVYFVYEK